MSRSSSNDGSTDLVIEVDASKFVPQTITDPKELERIRKLVADLEKYGYSKPNANEAPPTPDVTSPPEPA